jgi:hypothetical protein
MKTSMLHPAQRKRRTESRIVGQATTDEPIDRARSSVLCYNTLVLASSGAGTVSVGLATFRPMPCRFFSGRSSDQFAPSASSNPWRPLASSKALHRLLLRTKPKHGKTIADPFAHWTVER